MRLIPERFGGTGLKWVDLTVVLEETGRGLCPLPIISQTLAAAALLRCGGDAQKQKLLEIAQKCPVYRTLKGEVDIAERLAS